MNIKNKQCSTDNKICGVGCDVVSCKYHGGDNSCHADKITVESSTAIRKTETFCGTFTPKSSV